MCAAEKNVAGEGRICEKGVCVWRKRMGREGDMCEWGVRQLMLATPSPFPLAQHWHARREKTRMEEAERALQGQRSYGERSFVWGGQEL